MAEVPAEELLPAVDRRAILALFLAATGAWFSGAFPATVAPRTSAVDPEAADDAPAIPDAPQELAALGALLTTTDPAAAARLLAYARAEAAVHGIDLARAGTVPHLCRALLDGARVREDFIEGRLEAVAGWMLARSEAAACVVLHRASQSAVCVPDVC